MTEGIKMPDCISKKEIHRMTGDTESRTYLQGGDTWKHRKPACVSKEGDKWNNSVHGRRACICLVNIIVLSQVSLSSSSKDVFIYTHGMILMAYICMFSHMHTYKHKQAQIYA